MWIKKHRSENGCETKKLSDNCKLFAISEKNNSVSWFLQKLIQ